MKNIILSILVVTTLVAGGIGGTFAGFVDTEISKGNYIQAGISDLLVNNKNDPDVPTKIAFEHASPSKSTDFWVDLYNWGVCQGGEVYMEYKNIESVEAGVKVHDGVSYVYDGVTVLGDPLPAGYKVATGDEPKGSGVWSSEPEKIAEVGGGYVGQILVAPNGPGTLGEDYASGVSQHLDVTTTIPLIGAAGNILGNPDTNGDGKVDSTEYGAWVTAGNRWVTIPSLCGKLDTLNGHKDDLGFLRTQTKTYIHIDVVIQQINYKDITGVEWPDEQTKWWPTNALQGDKATWDMMFELNTDP
jgi:hypothetical protein